MDQLSAHVMPHAILPAINMVAASLHLNVTFLHGNYCRLYGNRKAALRAFEAK